MRSVNRAQSPQLAARKRNDSISSSGRMILAGVEGVTDPIVAVTRGALERLAPILMTALAAGLALVSLALSGGEPGSEMQTPMAIVILFGLLSSTALNMIVVSALYLRFGSVVRAKNNFSLLEQQWLR